MITPTAQPLVLAITTLATTPESSVIPSISLTKSSTLPNLVTSLIVSPVKNRVTANQQTVHLAVVVAVVMAHPVPLKQHRLVSKLARLRASPTIESTTRATTHTLTLQ